MAKKDSRIDAHIAKAAPFARPILQHLRALVHGGCPEVVETMKWSSPAFDYRGPFATRKKRLATTIEWLAQGKPRNWKYMVRKPAAKATSDKAPAKEAARRRG